MNKSLFILFSLIISNVVTAQKQEYYDMDAKHTLRKTRENNQSPRVYSVTMKRFDLTAQSTKKKVLNKNYAILNSEISKLVEDSLKVEQDYQLKLRDFVEVSKIKKLIESFLSSSKPYELKKKDLIEAQNLADTHGVKELIYADANVNTSQKGKFFIIQLDKLDLKVHLKKITWRLDQMDIVDPVKKSSPLLNKRLKDLRSKKRGVKKYKYIVIAPKKVIKNQLAINSSTPKTLSSLSGKYTKEAAYHLVLQDYKKMFKKGMLIGPEEVKKYKLESSGHVGPLQMLITHNLSKEQFIAQRTFLDAYAFTINGKFNTGKKLLVSRD